MEVIVSDPRKNVADVSTQTTAERITERTSVAIHAPVFITKTPLLRYIAEILFWLGISIGLGLLLSWMFKIQVPALPKMIDTPEQKIEEAAVDLIACENAVNKILKEQRIHFAVGSAKISQKGLDVVDQVVEEIKPCEGAKLEIQGHTDNTGSSANNIILSKKRADAVATVINQLFEKNGLVIFQIKTIGVGAGLPLASNDTAEGRYQNRRIEMRLYE